jgi:hypothetical protein
MTGANAVFQLGIDGRPDVYLLIYALSDRSKVNTAATNREGYSVNGAGCEKEISFKRDRQEDTGLYHESMGGCDRGTDGISWRESGKAMEEVGVGQEVVPVAASPGVAA